MSLTFRRVVAYLLDTILISLVLLATSVSPLNKNYERLASLGSEYREKSDEFYEKSQSEDLGKEDLAILNRDFNDYVVDVLYEQNRLSIYNDCIGAALIILYFGILPYFMGGETLGKKIMQIRVKSIKGNKLYLWQTLLRTIVLFGLPFTILNSILVFSLNKNAFASFSVYMTLASWCLNIALVIAFYARKDNRSIHDLIALTKVEMRD